VLIAIIAAAAQAIAGNEPRANFWAANARQRNPRLGRDDFFRAFPMKCGSMRAPVAQALAKLGF
jgi:predicted deacylase